MSLVKAKQLREERATLYAEAHKLIEKPDVTKEDKAKFDELMVRCDEIKLDIDRNEKDAALEQELRSTTAPPRDAIDNPADATEEQKVLATKRNEKRYASAFNEYLRLGSGSEGGMSVESRKILAEHRDMGIGTNTLGGYLVPQGFVFKLEEAMKWYGNMLGVSEIMDTASGNVLPYPTDNDTSNTGEIVGEAQQVTDADVTIGHVLFGAFKFSSKMVKASYELVQDSAFDVEALLLRKFAERLGRILNTKFTIGAGTTEPTGILTAAVANNGTPVLASTNPAYGVPLLAIGSSTNTGGAETGGTSFGSQDLVNLEHQVDPAYRAGAKYMMHDKTLRFAKALLDKYGRPLWVPGVAVNAPDTLNGYGYSINNDMPLIAVNATTVMFGQLQKYVIRRVKELGVVTLRERFADYGQIAWIGFARYDGNLVDAGTHPVTYLQQAAS